MEDVAVEQGTVIVVDMVTVVTGPGMVLLEAGPQVRRDGFDEMKEEQRPWK